jgi:uncharacterized membrane protein
MEGLLVLFALAVALALLAGPVLAVIALVKSQRLRRQAIESERRLLEIESKLGRLLRKRESIVEPRREPAPSATEPAREPPRKPSPEPTPEPLAPEATAAQRPTPPRSGGEGRLHPRYRPPEPVGEREVAQPAATPGEPAPASVPSIAQPPAPPATPSLRIDWERWIGIRGAAVVGAVALGLAGLLFFKYSIERGLITPPMRVVFGTLTGLGCVAGSEPLRPRGYRHAAGGLAGAGVVILYGAFWAAHALYGLIGMLPAFGLMALVTIVCGLLAVRRESLLVAVLGLIGGFATPLLLSSAVDRPIGLFGYVLLLDLGLLWIGHKRRWPSLGLLSLLGTVLLQALWVGKHMGPDRVFLGLAILALFGGLYVFWGRFAGEREPSFAWRWSRIGAVFFPFAFAVYFAGRVDLGAHLYPVALLLALLCAAAGWVSREQLSYGVGVGAVAASVAVIGVWLLEHPVTSPLAWEVAVVAVGLAALFHLFVERDPKPHGGNGPALAAMLAAGGFFALTLFAAATAQVPVWPWIAAWAAFAALLYRHAIFPHRGALQIGAALLLAFGLTTLHTSPEPLRPASPLFLALLVAAPLALHAAAMNRSGRSLRKVAEQAAGTLPILLLLGLWPAAYSSELGPLAALGTVLLLGVLALLAATRLGKGSWYAASVVATLLAQLGWTGMRPGLGQNREESLAAFLLLALAVVVFTLWPLVAAKRFTGDRLAWWTAALTGPAWFLSLRELYQTSFGDGFIGLLPVALGALALGAASRARRALSAIEPLRHSALVWLAAVALCFLALAIPLQLEKEWITLGWALEGLAIIALWKRLDHPGLKYFGLALLGAAAVRLVANPALLEYYPRSTTRIFNWLLYTYLVPATAMLGAAQLLRPLECGRARSWERSLYGGGRVPGATASSFAAILVVFVWINLTIADWFATGTALNLSFGDRPAQRLTVSIAWALYALLLLGFGMARDSLGLRWLSLGFLLVTIGKVFLYDLGALKDLYRVASLVGLALSLIFVSLLYQRFVFGKTRTEES